MKKQFLIIGSGFSGAVLARELVNAIDCHVEIWDERKHIAGNCHTERDSDTGVMVHKYGPHIFNTDNPQVWDYVRKYGEFRPFVNRVKAITSKGVYSLPINLLTINQVFGKTMSPSEAKIFIQNHGDKSIVEPANFEEQALKMVGKELYELFFKGYTIKQWGCNPKDLPASVLTRLPVRFNYDDNYYDKKYQGIPTDGYSALIAAMLNDSRIHVRLGLRFESSQRSELLERYDHLFYTGPLDAFFNFTHGRLGYRTVYFEKIPTDKMDYQGNAVINYTDASVAWTRIHEHKHFAPWESHERTSVFREFSKETSPQDIPYYPKRLAADKSALGHYRDTAISLAASKKKHRVSFLGRLATYRYLDMAPVILEALQFAEKFIRSQESASAPPLFSCDTL
jgi:UDP-galactopyranose mutase